MINISALCNAFRGKQGGRERRKVGNQAAKEASSCVIILAGQHLADPCLNLLNSVKVYYVPLSGRSFGSWSQPRWIIHSYIKRSFPRRVVMFQQRLNEVAPASGAPSHVLRWIWPDAILSSVSNGCSGVKGGLVFHRSPNAHNPPPDGSAHRRISYSEAQGVSEEEEHDRRRKKEMRPEGV